MSGRKFFWPLAVLAVIALAAVAFGAHRQSAWATLASHQGDLRAWVGANPLPAGFIYVACYAAAVALSLPLGGILTVTGGLLFGAVVGAGLAVAAASAGAVLLFLLARGVLAPTFASRAGPFLERVRPGLQRDGFSYLLALRLIPVVPFWLGNLASALLGMKLAPFAAATLLGIIPATAILAAIGAEVGDVLTAGGTPDLSLLGSPPVLLPLAGLAALSLAPVAWRRWRGQGGRAG